MPFFLKKKRSSKDNKDATATKSDLPPDMVYSMTPRHGHAQDVFDENNIRQVAGCLPIDPIHKRFLLVTSSSNPGTWVIPKGGWEKDETQQQAAMRETWEEAGVKGIITRHIGVFAEKTKNGVKAHHWVYEMEIKEVTKKFPEQKKRERRWFTYDEAMLVVKANYIHDALSMSSLSPLVHPYCESLQSDSPKKKEKKKEKKKKKQQEEEEEEEAAAELEREKKEKKEKKKEKKNEKKEKKAREEESIDEEDGQPLTEEQKEEKKRLKLEEKEKKKAAKKEQEEDDDDGEGDGEKKKKKKKKGNKKKGEISELLEEDIPAMYATPLGKVDPNSSSNSNNKEVEERFEPSINQQLRQTHISPQFPKPHQFPIPQQAYPSPPPPSQLQQQRLPNQQPLQLHPQRLPNQVYPPRSPNQQQAFLPPRSPNQQQAFPPRLPNQQQAFPPRSPNQQQNFPPPRSPSQQQAFPPPRSPNQQQAFLNQQQHGYPPQQQQMSANQQQAYLSPNQPAQYNPNNVRPPQQQYHQHYVEDKYQLQ